MNKKLQHLEPNLLWHYFEELCQYPRPSKKEEKVVEYVINLAKTNNINFSRDEAGNIVFKIPATKGMENKETVVLQSHLDMVCEKNSGTVHDFDNDPIKAFVDGDWVRAEGTTLGADNGIGAAASLAVIFDKDAPHGDLECLFTLDEETGLTGATNLSKDLLTGKIMLNMDSEEDGALYIGCSGGRDTKGVFKFKYEETATKSAFIEVTVRGLKGGHSGLDIQTGRGNAIKMLTRTLMNLDSKFKIRLNSINGGSKRNAIPREASAIISCEISKTAEIISAVSEYCKLLFNEISTVEPGLKIEAVEIKDSSDRGVIGKELHTNLLNALNAMPHGVLKMSADIPGLVETSCNLATIVTTDRMIEIGTSQRSSVESEIEDAVKMAVSVLTLSGAEVHTFDGYPGWKPDINSGVLNLTKKVYNNLYGSDPEVKAIHAGLECGIIKEKYPEMDVVSFGPTITGAHSPDESLHIPSTTKFYNILKEILKNVPDRK
ncbi:MAG: aminoacyl-histidine dipeptidase [Ignavibacteriaceae bacterium]|nr:aminoacyl-histidine dipeptidase [Ignavibacteriaceae bacterium]